jgi:hypothetical protein
VHLRANWLTLFAVIAFLSLLLVSAMAAHEGWLSPGQSFQAKAEKGKILTVKAKKGIVCVLLKSGKKDFDWDLTNNQKVSMEPSSIPPRKKGSSSSR